jgi:membrane protein YqaA with SNARE-associated domain
VPYLALFAVVFGINLLPAFGPPTWAVLVYTRLHWHLNPVALVLIGAIAATSGRYLLARGARHFKGHLPTRMKDNLEDAHRLIERRRTGAIALFGLFVVSPLPSAQLFMAAGLLDLPLGLFTLAFLLGRLVSYSIYVAVATVADRQFGHVLSQVFGSPWSIALQVLLLAAVCVLPFVNWRGLLDRHPKPNIP